MKIRIIKKPPIDPIHGVEEGQEYNAQRVEYGRANVRIVSKESGEKVCLEPWEWEEIHEWTGEKAEAERRSLEAQTTKSMKCSFCREELGSRYYANVPPDGWSLCLACHRDHFQGLARYRPESEVDDPRKLPAEPVV